MTDRVELQLEVDAPRSAAYELFATQAGLRRWLDAADLEERVGGAVRVRLRGAIATGKVLALGPPQHASFTWQWAGQRDPPTTVVAFDAIDHGARTHVTLRHVGLRSRAEFDMHQELWRHWLERFAQAVRELPREVVPG
jgi:uncharacterized protein YndB with AHSA1/START domain